MENVQPSGCHTLSLQDMSCQHRGLLLLLAGDNNFGETLHSDMGTTAKLMIGATIQ